MCIVNDKILEQIVGGTLSLRHNPDKTVTIMAETQEDIEELARRKQIPRDYVMVWKAQLQDLKSKGHNKKLALITFPENQDC